MSAKSRVSSTITRHISNDHTWTTVGGGGAQCKSHTYSKGEWKKTNCLLSFFKERTYLFTNVRLARQARRTMYHAIESWPLYLFFLSSIEIGSNVVINAPTIEIWICSFCCLDRCGFPSLTPTHPQIPLFPTHRWNFEQHQETGVCRSYTPIAHFLFVLVGVSRVCQLMCSVRISFPFRFRGKANPTRRLELRL